MLIALLAAPAYGQGRATPGPTPPPPKSQQEIEAERAAENAYKKSLSNIPDRPPADPWGIARSVDKPKDVAKSPTKGTKTGVTAN
jgi:hypothetical protein